MEPQISAVFPTSWLLKSRTKCTDAAATAAVLNGWWTDLDTASRTLLSEYEPPGALRRTRDPPEGCRAYHAAAVVAPITRWLFP